MKGLLKRLAPFAPDTSGAVSALFELGGLVVICDAGGCTGNICGFDEPRWFTMRSAVFSAGMRDMDAILGRDAQLVEKIVSAQQTVKAPFVVLAGTPVPAVIATDFKALRRLTEKKTCVPVLAVESTGVNHYDRGASRAFELLFDAFAAEQLPVEKETVGVIGATPLDLGTLRAGDLLREALGPGAQVYGMGAGLDAVRRASANACNLVVSPAGVAAAQLLEKRFGTPWRPACPYLPEPVLEALPRLKGKRVLAVHQQFACAALREKLLGCGAAAVAVCSWFSMTDALREPQDRRLAEEDDLAAAVTAFGADAVIADRVFEKVLPGFKGEFIDFPHFAVSGRLTERQE
ncbi:MAG: nitrogenase molybdenum-iron protein [Lentisphaeria bacterium]|nr:nitrogenase molybdenum-iron protein [Lentisphaeria bacterium]